MSVEASLLISYESIKHACAGLLATGRRAVADIIDGQLQESRQKK